MRICSSFSQRQTNAVKGKEADKCIWSMGGMYHNQEVASVSNFLYGCECSDTLFIYLKGELQQCLLQFCCNRAHISASSLFKLNYRHHVPKRYCFNNLGGQ
jgi:hypothetical protein